MSNNQIVSREEQIRQGIIPVPKNNYLPARPEGSFEFRDHDRSILSSAVNAASAMMTERQMTHIVKSDDTAVTQAQASLVYSAVYAFASALITGGMILLSWSKYGRTDNRGDYALLWLLLWGLCVLIALIVNRAQGLHYSASGIAHHELDSREAIAKYAIDKHVGLIEQRWRIDQA